MYVPLLWNNLLFAIHVYTQHRGGTGLSVQSGDIRLHDEEERGREGTEVTHHFDSTGAAVHGAISDQHHGEDHGEAEVSHLFVFRFS